MTMRKAHWSVAEAKASLSAVLEDAKTSPQVIENRGTAVAVVVSIAAYRECIGDPDDDVGSSRWKEFLRWNEGLRSRGGATLAVAAREPRPDPFRPKR